LRQILLNLIGNAVKFTDKGEVSLEVTQINETNEGTILRFSVHDTGIGISEEAQNKLFQSFAQADASTTRKFGGTGLGLAICRKLVELMGGSIGVTSTLGKGSTFWFTLPFARHKQAAPPLNRPADAVNGVHATPFSGTITGLRVLLVEDNKINQVVAVQLLKKFGCVVDTVDNGLKAMEARRQNKYDIILMDCQMPEMDGYEATRKIRELELKSSLPPVRIVAMTAYAMQGDRERCLAAGMDDYISKPVDLGELKSALEKAATKAEAQAKV